MKRTALALLILTAFAGQALAIDFSAPIRSIDGTPVPADPGKPELLTLGRVCEDALIAQLPNDQATPAEKNQRFWLAHKIHAGKEPLTADEITLAKKVIGLAYGPLVVGRAYELLDPASVPK